MAEIREGDYVRTIIEGRWNGHVTGPVFEGEQTDTDLVEYVSSDDDRVFLEKIEAPVVTFKPGDVVMHRDHDVAPILLVENGYVEFHANAEPTFYEYDGHVSPDTFTSKEYEKVGLTL